ncbi:MAG TPA: DUF1501 domain-containing protein [Verrucomicrobiota bacterium]|nr:sulfatase [Verrucomicrobiales bacterium]HRI15956.1 DUF1501 domain-containing protein [Verrucomicrobiota bacterium]
MNDDAIQLTRRDFLVSTSRGIGGVALASLLGADRLLAASGTGSPSQALSAVGPHFAPRAKNCIFLYMEGGVSQLDLFDPKPKLKELNGQKLPESLTKNVRFAFLQKDSAVLMGSPHPFRRYGQSGLEMSQLLPRIGSCADDLALVRSMHTEAFNHHPGELLMYCGSMMLGRPSVGSWVNYALGSPSQNLPGYVVLTAGRAPSGGNTMFQSGFLPSNFSGVMFRSRGEPVQDLNSPAGLSAEARHYGLDALRDLNALRQKVVGDPEIAARIANYELAARMQVAAPELTSFAGESATTLSEYGVDREAGGLTTQRGGSGDAFQTFSRNCLLARRMVERGVRFVAIHHASWDHHNDLDNDLVYNCRVVDQPVAALLQDLKQRGLLDETLVVWASEFGRTPLGENRPSFDGRVSGRDHHPFAFSVWLAGGGVRGGQVIGETDEVGWNVTREPVHVNDLHATILHLFGLDHERLTYRFQGRDFRLTDVRGDVVQRLVV